MAHTTTLPSGTARGDAPTDLPSAATRPPRKRGVFRTLVLVALLLVAVVLAYLGVTFFQVWSAANTDDARPASAIVVLGAAQYDGRPSPVLQERLNHAAELYKEGVAKTIVVSGGKQAGDRTTEGKASYDYLRAKGIPDSALKVEVGGTDTYAELSATSLILSNAKLGKDVVVVTDPYHATRSAAIAGQLGLDAHVSPSHGDSSFKSLAKETGAVAVGRIIGFRRLSNVV